MMLIWLWGSRASRAPLVTIVFRCIVVRVGGGGSLIRRRLACHALRKGSCKLFFKRCGAEAELDAKAIQVCMDRGDVHQVGHGVSGIIFISHVGGDCLRGQHVCDGCEDVFCRSAIGRAEEGVVLRLVPEENGGRGVGSVGREVKDVVGNIFLGYSYF